MPTTRGGPGPNVTIKDVAARAGVGVGTVSRVLNDHPSVTDETRARVRAAMRALDYQPSRVAQALSRRRSGVIAVLVPFFTQPSAVERLRGVMAAVASSSFEVALLDVSHGEHRSRHLARFARRDLTDAILVITMRPSADEARTLRASGVPVVFVDVPADGFPSVVVDNRAGGRLAARHLLDLGHRRIAFLGKTVDPRFGLTVGAQRRAGFEQELAEAGAPLDPRLVRETPVDRALAREAALDLLGRADQPTAVFCYADVQAFGVLEAAAELDVAVPEALSVVGFDDIDLAGVVGLTTVRQPLFDSGMVGATMLLERLAGGSSDVDSGPIVLPLEVVPRRTSARAAPAAPLPLGTRQSIRT